MKSKKLFTLMLLVFSLSGQAQIFDLKKSYTGSHYAFQNFDPAGINQFVVQFNEMWAADIATGFHQYDGSELGQTFTTSGLRFIWGDNPMKWTASSDYAFGAGKDKNQVDFTNGMSQLMTLRYTTNQVNNSFGVTFNEEKLWLEALYCTNLGKVQIEYSTVHPNGVESYGTEYKLNGLYIGTIKTMQFGAQVSYKYKKYVMYARALVPVAVLGPDPGVARNLVDAQSGYSNPKDFPSNYNTYINDPAGHVTRLESLQTTNFKGYSYGFGLFYLIGKDK
jgi:hypothetical protein